MFRLWFSRDLWSRTVSRTSWTAGTFRYWGNWFRLWKLRYWLACARICYLSKSPPARGRRAATPKDYEADAARTDSAAAGGRTPSVAEAPEVGPLRELPYFIGAIGLSRPVNKLLQIQFVYILLLSGSLALGLESIFRNILTIEEYSTQILLLDNGTGLMI